MHQTELLIRKKRNSFSVFFGEHNLMAGGVGRRVSGNGSKDFR